MPFFFKDDMVLIAHTTTKVDVPKKINRMPKESPELLDPETYRVFYIRLINYLFSSSLLIEKLK